MEVKTKATKSAKEKSNEGINNNSDGNRGGAWSNYIQNVEQMSKGTAEQYNKRLRSFAAFVVERYGYNLDTLIDNLQKNQKINPYDVLSGYVAYLSQKTQVSSNTLRQRVVTARSFLEYHDIEISPRKYKLKVKLPKAIIKDKEALTKDDIIEVLNACADLRLKTYIHVLAATGARATEALSTRICDLDLDSNPATLFVRGEYTKTRKDRRIFLTQEVAKVLTNWLEYKYRKRRHGYYDKTTGKSMCEYRTPVKSDKDLMFASASGYKSVSIESLYLELCIPFAKTLDRIGGRMGERENSNVINGRRRITLHSFRRFTKSTISDLGYGDFGEWFIGHSGSTYYRRSDKEKAELFAKIEPYLTFLDVSSLERKGADTEAKIEELIAEREMLKQNDIMKNEAITMLSEELTQLKQEVEIIKRQTNK